jgi:hypothetical protein
MFKTCIIKIFIGKATCFGQLLTIIEPGYKIVVFKFILLRSQEVKIV